MIRKIIKKVQHSYQDWVFHMGMGHIVEEDGWGIEVDVWQWSRSHRMVAYIWYMVPVARIGYAMRVAWCEKVGHKWTVEGYSGPDTGFEHLGCARCGYEAKPIVYY